MSDLKQLAAVTALNDMFQRGHLSICTIDSIGRMLGIDPKRGGDSYNILQSVHCVDFAKMPMELRDAIPGLIRDCLSVEPTYQFKQPITLQEFVERVPEPQRGAIARLLSFGGGKKS